MTDDGWQKADLYGKFKGLEFMKKMVVGIIFSSVFIYFSVRGLEFDKILEALRNVKYFYLIIAILLFLSLSALRSLRWG